MALSSYATELYVGGVFVAEVTGVSVGGSSLTEIDITSLTATDKSYIMGSLEPGSLTVEMFAPSNFSSFGSFLTPESGDSVPSACQLVFSGGSLTASFNAISTNLSISAEQDGAVTASVTLKLTTAITWN